MPRMHEWRTKRRGRRNATNARKGGQKEEEEEIPQMKTRIIIYSFVFNSCIRGDQIK